MSAEPEKQTSPVTFRLLTEEEWPRLDPIFAEEDWRVPHFLTSVIAVGEMDGEIVLAWPLQSILHPEPLWIKPELRGKLDWTEAAKLLESQIGEDSPYTGLVVIAQSKVVENMCRKMGFKEYPGVVFTKDIRGGG